MKRFSRNFGTPTGGAVITVGSQDRIQPCPLEEANRRFEPVAVPEPATWSLAYLAAIALVPTLRRGRGAKA